MIVISDHANIFMWNPKFKYSFFSGANRGRYYWIYNWKCPRVSPQIIQPTAYLTCLPHCKSMRWHSRSRNNHIYRNNSRKFRKGFTTHFYLQEHWMAITITGGASSPGFSSGSSRWRRTPPRFFHWMSLSILIRKIYMWNGNFSLGGIEASTRLNNILRLTWLTFNLQTV